MRGIDAAFMLAAAPVMVMAATIPAIIISFVFAPSVVRPAPRRPTACIDCSAHQFDLK
jgi:hypothetical protein